MRRNTFGKERRRVEALRATGLLTLVIGLLALPSTAGAATAGGLKPLPTKPCLSDDVSTVAGCTDVRAMQNIGRIAVSPQGESVYVPSRDKDAIVAFDRNTTTGVLTQKTSITGCYTSNTTVATADSCNLATGDTTALDGVNAVVVSPDGESVYATTASGRVTGFNRDDNDDGDDGTLSFNQVLNTSGSGSPADLAAVVVSVDGASVYAAGPAYGGLIQLFIRNRTAGPTLGDLSFNGCFGATVCTTVNGLQAVRDLAITPDDKQLIVAAGDFANCCSWATLGFDRNTSNGALTPPTTSSRCVTGNSGLGNCQFRSGAFWPRALALADNGSRVYVGGNEIMYSIDRNPSTNELTAVTTGRCATYNGSGYPGCTELPQGCSNFCTETSVLVPPDGANLYVSANGGTPTIFAFNRSSDGSFALKPSPLACLSQGGTGNCSVLSNGNHIESLAADKDSHNVYAAGVNRLFSFAIDRPPTCQNVSASTAHNTSVAVTLNCSDPDGDNVVYEKVGDPVRGTLGGIVGNTINYNPLTGTSGTDSFTYRAVAAGAASDPATATVTVAAAPPPTAPSAPPPPPPPPVTLIPSTVTNKWSAFPRFTTVRGLSVKTLPAGTKVKTTCKTKSKRLQKKRCPYKSRTVSSPAARAKLNLAKPFRKRKLPIGTRITITVTAPGFIGKVFTYTVRRRALPSFKLTCLPPGATKPTRCT